MYPEAREVFVEKVEKLEGAETAAALEAGLGETASGWTVEFHIIDAPRAGGGFTIPFFSRITLRDEARALRGMAFSVALKFIPT